MGYAHDRHLLPYLVDLIQDAIAAAMCAVGPGEVDPQRLADPVRVLGERPV
jgi:hypothetical protein